MKNPYLEKLGNWLPEPHKSLRKYPHGTFFLLHTATGLTHLCMLTGNLPTDESWKAVRLTDYKYIRLEKLRKGALALVLEEAPHTTS